MLIVITGRNRSGTTAFRCTLANNKSFINCGEIFNPNSKSSYGFATYLKQNNPDQLENFLTKEIKFDLFKKYFLFLKKQSLQSHLVCDIKYPFPFPSNYLEFVDGQIDYLINIIRKNQLKRIISQLVAQKTGRYTILKAKTENTIDTPEITIDETKILSKIKKEEAIIKEFSSDIENYIKKSAMICIYYEDMWLEGTEKYSSKVQNQLHEFLGINNLINQELLTKKNLIDDLSQLITNYSQVKEILSHTEYSWMTE